MIIDLQQKYDTGFTEEKNMIQDLQDSQQKKAGFAAKHDTGFAASPEKEEVSVEKPVSARGVLFVLSYLTRAT